MVLIPHSVDPDQSHLLGLVTKYRRFVTHLKVHHEKRCYRRFGVSGGGA